MKKILACASVAALLPATGFAIPTIYTYTGAPFSSFVDFAGIPGAYDNSMRVTGSVTLADALAPNTALTNVIPTSFSFSDGRTQITNANLDSNSINFISLATNASGGVGGWDVSLRRVSGLPSPADVAFIGSTSPCSGQCDIGVLAMGVSNDEGVSTLPGTWNVTPVPEPSTYALFLAGIALVGFAAHRQNKLPH